jgi:hypothetical protein
VPWVETALFRAARGPDLALLINLDRTSAEGIVRIRGDYSAVIDAQDRPVEVERKQGELTAPLRLPPHGVVVWTLAK